MMAVCEIIRLGNPVLRQKAKPFTKEEILKRETKALIKDMDDTMAALGGIGIAAPQIGISKQAAIIEIKKDNPRYKNLNVSGRYVIFNPIISIVDDQKTGFWEGCLSVPGIRGCVERASAIKVEYLDETANAQSLYLDDFRAVVFQHELDHLFGVVFLDRITDTTKIAFQEEFDQFISPAQS